MSNRRYDAIVLDLDGTLLDEKSRVHPRSLAALRAAREAGVRVMIATGRSSISAHAILAELDLDTPAIVFNGAGLYSARERRMLEERVLSRRALRRALAFAAAHDLSTVVMRSDAKFATPPRDECEAAALALMTALRYVERPGLEVEFAMRVTLFSRDHATSEAFAGDVERALDQPSYLTHFPLSVLASHRSSPLHVVDLQPPCRGKAEALRVLEEQYGIPRERVVAVGDATNDLPMLAAAGLSVAMGDGMPEARRAASRIIGGHDSTAIAELVEELFLDGAATLRDSADAIERDRASSDAHGGGNANAPVRRRETTRDGDAALQRDRA
jgi:Cof subfamily protein (haloacid dehalogenase superfamily)